MMTVADKVSDYKRLALAALESVKVSEVSVLVHYLEAVRKAGAAVYVLGNGGSQATAQHLVLHLRDVGLRAYDLMGDNAWLTAQSNDHGYGLAAAALYYQLRRQDDALLVISGSGKSENVMEALSNAEGVKLGILGFGGGPALSLCDAAVTLPQKDYGPVEDAAVAVVHMIQEGLK